MDTRIQQDKTALRRELLGRRRSRPAAERSAAAEALAQQVLANPALLNRPRVACYLPLAEEPDTRPLIAALRAQGTEVVVPLSDPETRQLDWALVDDGTPERKGAYGIAEPTGARLGPHALATCQVAFVPALAVDHRGRRLGRGAGYYDRALENYAGLICAIVFADELLPEVPAEDHDIPAGLALTPAGLFRPEA